MEFSVLDPIVEQWTTFTASFKTAANNTVESLDVQGLSAREIEQVRRTGTGRHEMLQGALKAMHELRENLVEWGDPEFAPMIGNLSAGYALEALQVIFERAPSVDSDRDAKAFARCCLLAGSLRAEMTESLDEE